MHIMLMFIVFVVFVSIVLAMIQEGYGFWVVLILILVAMVSCSGCTMCKEHPVACSVAVGVVATSVAISVYHGGSSDRFHRPATATIQPPPCASNPMLCQ